MIDRRWEILFSFFVFQIHSMNYERNRNKTNNDETQFNNLSSDLVFFFSFFFSVLLHFDVLCYCCYEFFLPFFCWFFFSLLWISNLNVQWSYQMSCTFWYIHLIIFVDERTLKQRWNHFFQEKKAQILCECKRAWVLCVCLSRYFLKVRNTSWL